ncbi:putative toxin-antitoxin system antitoxin component, TIGR02293 family [Mucilaginibacter mallensis]|uniref:Putative toxin-antitoxin system antitoxin component, TIGR02293 family n=1 Tax=Mucilaginibacter mallensis TaxID=652787 RepID=A0A1H1R3Y3_MUCMA|nr:antitoxin Xre-like helix-turn-helix domain-containing protein [Mucilaginibacter mallensis]SDS30206.1 putative toxin-antitoxin system antitoxin component, TIGR02293 family [Mucilaginibacter mallensis]
MSDKKKHIESFVVSEPEVAYAITGTIFSTTMGEAARNFGLMSMSDQDMVTLARQGLPKRIILSLARKISLTIQDLAGIMHISERTLQRYDDNEVIKTEYSEKAIELARLYTRGNEVFGSIDNFKIWMKTPSIIFNGESPLALLDTSVGFDMVFTELGRIEHGIFA